MIHLYNSEGYHIATEFQGHLYSVDGENIGHFASDQNLFIDLKGFYLGEIISTNRLVYNTKNKYIGLDFGEIGEQWGINNDEQDEIDEIRLPSNYRDI